MVSQALHAGYQSGGVGPAAVQVGLSLTVRDPTNRDGSHGLGSSLFSIL